MSRRRKNRFISGDYNIISDLTGQKIKRSEAKFTWDGFLVEKTHWEPKHPQLDIKGRAEDISVPDPRPRKTDTL